jgi:magnesium-transporting ATPase (P-type)
VGIGVNESDGTFSADFVIKKLSDIEKIVREGKSTNQRVVEAIYITASSVWLTVPLMMLMLRDHSIFRQSYLIFRFVVYMMPQNILFSFAKPR